MQWTQTYGAFTATLKPIGFVCYIYKFSLSRIHLHSQQEINEFIEVKIRCFFLVGWFSLNL